MDPNQNTNPQYVPVPTGKKVMVGVLGGWYGALTGLTAGLLIGGTVTLLRRK